MAEMVWIDAPCQSKLTTARRRSSSSSSRIGLLESSSLPDNSYKRHWNCLLQPWGEELQIRFDYVVSTAPRSFLSWYTYMLTKVLSRSCSLISCSMTKLLYDGKEYGQNRAWTRPLSSTQSYHNLSLVELPYSHIESWTLPSTWFSLVTSDSTLFDKGRWIA